MAKVITQETFDDVVKENIVEFAMSAVEAKEETIQQFEAQGINLANIIKDLNLNETSGEPVLKETIDALKANKTNPDEINKNLEILTAECKLTVPHRVLAAKLGAYGLLLDLLESEQEIFDKIKYKAVVAANAIIDKHPDVFSDRSLKVITRLLHEETDPKMVCNLLKWLHKACILHEINRQCIMDENSLIQDLKALLKREEDEVVKNACALFRCLILDDDIRVEFGKAHEHARTLANETLKELTLLLTKFRVNQNLVCELFLTLAALMVRNEFCQVVEEAGGLKFIMDAMVEFPESIKITREALKLLKALAGNDGVKVKIIQSGAAPLIESALNANKDNEAFAGHALACVSQLSLREVANSKALFETGIAETIIQTMKIHPTSKVIQRNGSWSIRNMVSRSRDQCDAFITFGAEDVLNAALKDHPTISQDVKSALRDLGLKVQLNEEWKGKAEYEIRKEM